MKNRGYFGLAIYHPKYEVNYGSLIRTANILGASFVIVIGKRFKKQPSDTQKSYRHMPIFECTSIQEFKQFIPYDCQLVGVELNDKSTKLKDFVHPERAVYLMGAEDHGIPQNLLDQCQHIVQLEGKQSMNVAVAGSIVLYHRQGL